MRMLFTALLLTAMAGAACAGDTIAGILANPSWYDRKHVEVTGMVTLLARNVSPAGSGSETLRLCGGTKCVNVLLFGRTALSNGMYVTVAGLFSKDKQGGTIQATAVTP